MASTEALYTNKIFLCGALPLLKTIVADVPSLKSKFENIHCVYQVSCLDPEVEGGKRGMHFVVNSGEWLVHTCLTKDPHIELEFKSVENLNDFFKGKITPAGIPKIKGIKHAGTLVSFVMVLLKMANLLGATEAPKDEETKELLVKCYFYLLSSGISQLNKMGHPEIKDWTSKSPDRVYAFAVDGYPQVSAFIRIKAGKSRAGRGEYKRAMPFFTLRFNNLDSALGILMSTDDMLDATKKGRLIMDGGPEFGAQLGGFMLEIGALAK